MRCVKQRQQGLAVVEFAIVLPLIILIAAATVELGRGLYQYNTLTKAVRDGARFMSDVAIGPLGIMDDTTFYSYVPATENLVIYGNIAGSGDPLVKDFDEAGRGTVSVTRVDVTLDGGGISPNHIQVTATYVYEPLFSALSALGYAMKPTMTATTIERALTL